MKHLIINSKGLLIVLYFLVFNNFSAQTYDSFPVFIQEVERYYDSGVFLQFNKNFPNPGLDNNAFAGKKAVSTATKNTFRLIYTWDVSSIPDNATIESAVLYFAGTPHSNLPVDQQPFTINIEFKQFPNDKFNSDASLQWDAITNSTQLFVENVPRTTGEFSGSKGLNSSALTYIKGSLSQDRLHIALRGTDEETFGTNRNTHYIDYKRGTSVDVQHALKIVINYTTPIEDVNLTAKNRMGTYEGGLIGVGVNENATDRTSPYSFPSEVGDNVNLAAIENQGYGGYNWIWNDTEAELYRSEWEQEYPDNRIESRGFSESISRISAADDNNSIYIANLRKVFDINFQNQFSGTSEGGQMYVNDSLVTAPTAQYNVVEQNQINVNAKQSYIINGIVYDFEKWSDNVTNSVRSIYPTSNDTYTAIYKGTPAFDGLERNLTISGTGSQNYIKLTWNEHPNTNVTQYHIYRYYKRPNGTVTSPVQIATVNQGSSTYIDTEFNYNPGSGDFILWYDVKAYYSLEGTISPSAYVSTKGEQGNIIIISKEGADKEITTYDITNYPNPYNPQTTIRFQLPQEGFVTIKVYDAIGKEVATLLNEEKDSGIYELKFNGIDLPSGMYIYTIKANDYFASKKMLLVK